MNSSFLYHAWGLYNHKCTCEEYNETVHLTLPKSEGKTKASDSKALLLQKLFVM